MFAVPLVPDHMLSTITPFLSKSVRRPMSPGTKTHLIILQYLEETLKLDCKGGLSSNLGNKATTTGSCVWHTYNTWPGSSYRQGTENLIWRITQYALEVLFRKVLGLASFGLIEDSDRSVTFNKMICMISVIITNLFIYSSQTYSVAI